MSSRTRQGVTVLEFIIVLPLLIMMLMAVVQLGLIISNRQTVEMATRAGALTASQSNLPNAGSVPAAIIDAVGRELANVGIDINQAILDGEVKVRLEHNISGDDLNDLDPPAVLVSGTLDCPSPDTPPPPDPDLSIYGRQYVRLSVCVRSDLIAPNLLKTYCFDLEKRVTQQTKTYRYAPAENH